MRVVMWRLFEHDSVMNHARERALLKGAWACVASENKALTRHQQTGVMWNLQRPAAPYCIFHRLASPLAPYLPFFFFFPLQLLPKTPPVVFISLILLVALPLRFSLLQPSYCEKPLQTNFPLSLIDSLSLSVSLPFFLSFSRCAQSIAFISVCRASPFSPLSFFFFFLLFRSLFFLFFFFWNFLHRCPPLPPPLLPNTFVPSELDTHKDKTRAQPYTHCLPSRAL